MEAPTWADCELGHGAQFGNRKLNCRLVKVVSALASNPTETVENACVSWKNTKGTYRFWSNAKVTPEGIFEPHVLRTAERAQNEHVVLAVQDTTELNFSTSRAANDLGMLDHPKCRGLKVHTVLCVSGTGVPLGVLNQKVWTRDPQSRKRKRKYQRLEIAQKESVRWLEGQRAAEEHLASQTRVITVGDRESDIFDLFAQPRRDNSELLVRVQATRRLVDDPARHLNDAIRTAPSLGTKTVEIAGKNGEPSRTAELTVRCKSLEILPPQKYSKRKDLNPVPVGIVLAEEECPPNGTKPVSWLLMTTLPTETFADAERCVQFYSYRWLIERFHYVLKSGCGMEDMQLATAQRLQNALATKSIVAWRLLWMTYHARVHPDAPAGEVVSTEEWEVVSASVHYATGAPVPKPTVREAVRMIAKLGGFLGRKHDGEPGVKTLWRGMEKLQACLLGWRLAKTPLTPEQGYG